MAVDADQQQREGVVGAIGTLPLTKKDGPEDFLVDEVSASAVSARRARRPRLSARRGGLRVSPDERLRVHWRYDSNRSSG